MIDKERISYLNKNTEYLTDKKFVVYWMQQSQRYEYNHALEYAVFTANEIKKPENKI